MNNVYIPKVRRNFPDRDEIISADKIMSVVQNYFGVSRDDLLKKSRKVHVLYPRQVCQWLMDKWSAHSHKGIGVIFEQDRTSVYNSIGAIDNYMACDDKVKEQIQALEKLILDGDNKS